MRAFRIHSAERVPRICSRLLLTALLALSGAPVRAQDPLEAAVKATYLYKLGAFVTWPEEAFAPGGPALVCVVGTDGFGSLLDEALTGETIAGRPIDVRRVAHARQSEDCHIAVIAGSPAEPVASALEELRGDPVLTVTDEANDPNARGMVHFVIVDDRVRFEIDDRAAWESGIAISSKVLELAVAVKPRPVQ